MAGKVCRVATPGTAPRRVGGPRRYVQYEPRSSATGRAIGAHGPGRLTLAHGGAEAGVSQATLPEEMANHLGMFQLDLSDSELRAHAAAHARAVDATLRELLSDAVAQGEPRSGTDVPRLARAVKITTDGSLLRWALTGEGDPAALLRDDLDHLLGRIS